MSRMQRSTASVTASAPAAPRRGSACSSIGHTGVEHTVPFEPTASSSRPQTGKRRCVDCPVVWSMGTLVLLSTFALHQSGELRRARAFQIVGDRHTRKAFPKRFASATATAFAVV